jgi:hypothetical protein
LSWRALAKLSEQVGRAGGYPASTMHDAVVVRQSPPLGLTLHIVQLCGGNPADLHDWGDHWAKLDHATREQHAAGGPRGRRPSPSTHDAETRQLAVNSLFRLLEVAMNSRVGTRRLILLLTIPLLAVIIAFTGTALLLATVFQVSPQYLLALTGMSGGILVAAALRRAWRSAAARRDARRGDVTPPYRGDGWMG